MASAESGLANPVRVGRYIIFGEIAAGGMAAVHWGLLNGSAGFRRPVAIKRLHAGFATDAAFVEQFLDEAHLAARIRHPNVVQTLDVVAENDELLLVMEYVEGETVAHLLKQSVERGQGLPIDKAVGIIVGALHGLHAAHEAKDGSGAPLHIVHRDVSPQNVIVGRDGVTRVLDFGVAKAAAQMHSTAEGKIKGKLRYMSPEQMVGENIDRQTDVFAAGIVLWEMLAGRRLFNSPEGAGAVVNQVLNLPIQPPSTFRAEVPQGLDRVVMKALERDRSLRFATARAFALELENVIGVASPHELGVWLESVAGKAMARRGEMLADVERWEGEESGMQTAHAWLESRGRSGTGSAPLIVIPKDRESQTAMNTVTSLAGGRSALPRWVPLAGAALFLTAASLWFGSRLSTPAPTSGPVAAVAPVAAIAPTVAAQSAPPTPAAEPPPATPSATAQPGAAQSAAVQPAAAQSAAGQPAATSTSSAKVAAVTKPVAKPKADCSSPTYVDKSGIRRFKPQCL